MTKITMDKEERNRLKTQAKIMENYGDKVKANQAALCAKCAFKNSRGNCQHGLLPVCLDGTDCFYFAVSAIDGN